MAQSRAENDQRDRLRHERGGGHRVPGGVLVERGQAAAAEADPGDHEQPQSPRPQWPPQQHCPADEQRTEPMNEPFINSWRANSRSPCNRLHRVGSPNL